MKKIFLLHLLLLCAVFLQAQSPVNWKYTVKRIADKIFEIHLKAAIENPWHMYSQNTPEGGPIPTAIQLDKNPLIILENKFKEMGKMIRKHEKVFDLDVMYYEDSVDFVQVIKLKTKAKTNISGEIEYMVCNDRECFPPTKEKFKVKVE